MRGPICSTIGVDLYGPVFDLYKIYIYYPVALYRTYIGLIRESLESRFNLKLKLRRPTGKKLERYFVLADNLHTEVYLYAVVFEGNGIVDLRRAWEPESLEIAPASFDGNINHFYDTNLYSRPDGLQIQINFLRSRIEEGVQILETVLGDVGVDDPTIGVKFMTTELAWHRVSDGVERYLEQRSRQMREEHPEVNLGGLRSDGSARGYRANSMAIGVDSCAYQKGLDTVREEIALKEPFFDKHKTALNKMNVSDKLNWIVQQATGFHSQTYGSQPPSRSVLSKAEAHNKFAEACPRRFISLMIECLRANAGLIVVKSANRSLYRAARLLVKSGRLERDVARKSTYRLTARYRPLLLDSIAINPGSIPKSDPKLVSVSSNGQALDRGDNQNLGDSKGDRHE